MDVKFTSRDRLTKNDKARKNALILIIRNLNKVKSIKAIEHEIKKHMGEKKFGQYLFQN